MDDTLSKSGECKSRIILELQKARNTIETVIFMFTDRDIAKEFTNAAKRGVRLKVVLDKNDTNNEIASLLNQYDGIELKVENAQSGGINHHKFTIIDGRILMHGTYNYTYSADSKNNEVLNVTDSFKKIGEYQAIFKNIFGVEIERIHDVNISLDSDYITSFSNILKNHISHIYDEFNSLEIENEGKKLAEDNDGQENVFVNYLDSALNRVRQSVNQDDNVRIIVKSKMKAALQNYVDNNGQELEATVSRINEIEKSKKERVNNEIDRKKSFKKEIETELHNSDKNHFEIKHKIDSLKEEIDSVDQHLVVEKFWSFPSILKLLILLIFFGYLSVFFSSSIWKIFFEEGYIMEMLSRGVTPDKLPLIDANAIDKLYTKKGLNYSLIGALFFLIPVLLTSIKLFAKNNKVVDFIMGWIVGIFLIDIVVAILISQHATGIQAVIIGEESNWELKQAIMTADFWLIFIFGSLPLFLTKSLIHSLWLSYNKSKPELINKEKHQIRVTLKRKVGDLELEKIKLQKDKESIQSRFDEINNTIQSLEREKSDIEDTMGQKRDELKQKVAEKNSNLRQVHDSYEAGVDSGSRELMKEIVLGRITYFKQGFYSYLNGLYRQNVATDRINLLESRYDEWLNKSL